MRHLDLFSGIGGFALAARWAGIETVAFCEIEEFPRKVLAKNFPGVPIHRDIHDLDGSEYAGIDLITGGYPCQPFSLAGVRKGTGDDRHLWPEMFRIIRDARPRYVVAENVIGHLSLGFDAVCDDLEGEGYEVWAFVIPACAKDAPHKRDRVWIVAYSNKKQKRAGGFGWVSESKRDAWPGLVLPRRERVADGIPHWVDRCGAAGNAIVPQVAYEILRTIRAV
jgi:DNA (cytosine-5)-methyltransferase 1